MARLPLGNVYNFAGQGFNGVNIDGATGDVARTTSGAIENAKYTYSFSATAAAVSGEFDSAVTRTGRLTLKLSNTDTLGRCTTSLASTDGGYAGGFKITAGHSYTATCWVKTDNVAADAVYITFIERNENHGAYAQVTNTSSKLTGTNDWTLITLNFTVSAGMLSGIFNFINNVAGNISDAWFDVNNLRLTDNNAVRNPASARTAITQPRNVASARNPVA